MDQPTTIQYPISDIMEWEYSNRLTIAPKFQRRDVWTINAKSYLIDSILLSMPIPPVYVRLLVDANKQITIREVVDGQQRLRAILGYLKNEFPINKAHNKEFGGLYYSDLPEEIRKKVLSYKFTVNVLENISDAEVLAIFARINSYTLTLNAQEKRNANFFGNFKQVVYGLAFDHYQFWLNNKILTDNQIARMKEAELVSILLITMIGGIQQTKSADIEEYYEKYDEEFSDTDKVVTQFHSIIDIIGDIFQGQLSNSDFRRHPLFYSLFVAIFDAKFGLPNTIMKKRVEFSHLQNRKIFGKLQEIDEALSMKSPPEKFLQFVDASQRSTADIGRRKARHEFLCSYLFS